MDLFKHEWIHSLRLKEDIIQPSETSSIVYDESIDYTIVNWNEYDWDTIMVYNDGCVH